MSETVKVRVTLFPDEELTVSPSEYTELRALGLVLDTKAETPAGLQKAAEKQISKDN